MAGETDRKKIMKELGVSINTIYNVTADLTTAGYPLAIHQKKKVFLITSPNSSLTPNNSSQPPNSSSQSPPQTIPGLTPEQTAGLLKLLGQSSGGNNEEKESEKTSPEISPQ